MIDEHITQARLAALELVYEVQVTLMLLEQLPSDERPTPEHVEDLTRLLEHRQEQVTAAIQRTQGRLASAANYALVRAGVESNKEIPR